MKIILEKKKCISCGSCEALDPKHFKLDKNHKCTLLKGKNIKDDIYELEVNEIGQAQDAADACPAQCIHIEK